MSDASSTIAEQPLPPDTTALLLTAFADLYRQEVTAAEDVHRTLPFFGTALGIVVGINPSVGFTTFLVILLAWAFGLNHVASQIGAHSMTPLHLLLFLPFIQLGVHLFHTRRLPLDRRQLEHLSHHPWRLIHAIWQWEWHALIVWGIVAAISMPLIAIYLRRALVMLMRRNRTLMASRPTVR